MKQNFPKLGIKLLCRQFGKTRHAYYDHQWRVQDLGLKDEIVLQHVLDIRKKQNRIGTLKLHYMLQEPLGQHGIKIGRDYLFDLMREHSLYIRNRKRKVFTTNSRHWMHKYNNLIKELVINHPEQVWVSDITYIQLRKQWGYLSLITDAYSKKIMGWAFRKDLSAQGCTDALEMAVADRKYPETKLIHHSDRGSQYCSKAYVDLLIRNRIAISMTENGDPYENAIAERVNGILKAEFDLYGPQTGLKETTRKIRENIQTYNQIRPHASCDYLTPEQAHHKQGELKKRWKPKKYKQEQSATCITESGIIDLRV
ncbi:IS3 family transposase [Pedobacter metabolipauper]|uniref:Transposase InsO family protein n=1 Tax=Pedobacter metabolipauper TaxID=425513 RepID=A0A4R6T0I1_9SPHI|nr:IS3 family transposase [Pedobacter metabolipauper]TDQ11887.1 transposase InsO family protein [Pedobacter metabolipauper]